MKQGHKHIAQARYRIYDQITHSSNTTTPMQPSLTTVNHDYAAWYLPTNLSRVKSQLLLLLLKHNISIQDCYNKGNFSNAYNLITGTFIAKNAKKMHFGQCFHKDANAVSSYRLPEAVISLCVTTVHQQLQAVSPSANQPMCLLDVRCIKLIQFASLHVLEHNAVALQLQLARILHARQHTIPGNIKKHQWAIFTYNF